MRPRVDPPIKQEKADNTRATPIHTQTRREKVDKSLEHPGLATAILYMGGENSIARIAQREESAKDAKEKSAREALALPELKKK